MLSFFTSLIRVIVISAMLRTLFASSEPTRVGGSFETRSGKCGDPISGDATPCAPATRARAQRCRALAQPPRRAGADRVARIVSKAPVDAGFAWPPDVATIPSGCALW